MDDSKKNSQKTKQNKTLTVQTSNNFFIFEKTQKLRKNNRRRKYLVNWTA